MVSFAARWLSALRGPPFKAPRRPVTDKHGGGGGACVQKGPKSGDSGD